MTIYVISKLWTDALENRNAHGYRLIGMTDDEEEVEKFQNETVPGIGYPLQYVNGGKPVPKYKVEEVKTVKWSP